MPKRPHISNNDRQLFRDSMQGVKPLKPHDTVHHEKAKPKAKRITQPSYLSTPEADLSTPEHVIEPDQPLFFAGNGIQHRVLKKLKRGEFPWEASLDLHGHTVEEASIALQRFLDDAHHHHCQCIRIVHGKGRNLDKATLKTHLNHWLGQTHLVLAFCSAMPRDGGLGAVYVLLRKNA